MSAAATGIFRSFGSFNYRVWAAGALVSNVGTWMQRTAQDWLVLTQLTHHKRVGRRHGHGAAVRAAAFSCCPGRASRPIIFNQRRLLIATQATMGALALGLGLLTVAGIVQLWHVYAFAFLFGCATAFVAPVRQTFVAELVGDADLPNAVALQFHLVQRARMVGLRSPG